MTRRCLKLVISLYFLITDLFLFYPLSLKISEKLVYNRIIDYVSKYKILFDNQFGFRKQHSIYYALTLLYDKIPSAIDNNEITVGIIIDLSQALDIVSHHILLKWFTMSKLISFFSMVFAVLHLTGLKTI